MIRWAAASSTALMLGFTLAPSASVAEATTHDRPWHATQIATFDYGVYCAALPEELEEAPATASGTINLVPIPDFQYRQLAVPAAIGIAFGVVLQAEPGVVLDPAVITVTHPPYPGSGIEVEQWIGSFDGEAPGLVGFSFEVESELVTGPWTFEAEHDGKPIFSITFDVVPPEVFPEIAGSCTGNLLF